MIDLPLGRWTPANHRRLRDLLDGSPAGPGDAPPVAVFDFDNTIVRGDTGSEFYLDLVERLALRDDDDGLRRVVDVLGDGDRILDLQRRARDGRGSMEDFRAAMIGLYLRVYDAKGIHVAYPWVTRVLAGTPEADVRRRARELARRDHAIPFELFRLPAEGGGRSLYCRGSKPFEEMAALLAALAERGFEVHVITGTCGLVVEEYVRVFGLAVTRVHGMELETAGGVLTDRVVLPATVGGGKFDCIRARIGRRPVLVAGDGPTDLAMMLYARDVALYIGEPDTEVGRIATGKGWLVQPSFDGPTEKPL
jgi:phosphoserine phosphatase